jgi:hypothetical protein
MRPGERQVAPSIDGIRQDHVARYQWADSIIPAGASVLDLGLRCWLWGRFAGAGQA